MFKPWNEQAWERHKRLTDDRSLLQYGSSSGSDWRWYSYPTETVWLNYQTADEHRSYPVQSWDKRLEEKEWPLL